MQSPVQSDTTALPLRDHTILGVCEAIGEDFGINPLWIRVPLAAAVLWSVEYAIAAYLALGLIVLGSRLLFPNQKVTSAEAPAETAQAIAPEEEQREQLPLAA